MKCLVTGGAGFIGSQVVRQLVERGDDVRVLHLPKENLRNLTGLPVELRAGDITSDDDVRAAVAGCEMVFHLAAIYALWLPRPQLMREVNVEGTRKVLRACLDARVRKVVFTSSIAVFGGQGRNAVATEESPFRLGTTGELYAISKFEAHQVARTFAEQGLDVTIVAPTGPLGPGDVGPTPTGRTLLTALRWPVVAVPDSISSVVDVRDCARGHLLAAERGRRGESYLLGGANYTLAEVVRTALAVAGMRKPVLIAPHWLLKAGGYVAEWATEHVTRRAPLITAAGADVMRLGLAASNAKAVAELGLPQTPLETTVRDAVLWFAANGYLPPATATRIARYEPGLLRA